MSKITKISKSYLMFTIVILLVVVVLYLFPKLYFEPPIFIPPDSTETYLFEEGIKNFTNLESFKKSCERFARCTDEFNAWNNYHFEQTEKLLNGAAKFGVFILLFYSWGYWKIYKASKEKEGEADSEL